MKSSNIAPILGLVFSCILAFPVHAEGPVIRSGDTVAVEANQVLEGDFYALGETVTLSGPAERDVYTLGRAITVNAPIAEDFVAAGVVVQVQDIVKDDVRVLGGDVVIAEPVTDDVVFIGGTLRILSTASIGGDLIFFGGEVRIDGPVEGNVYGTAGEMVIATHIGGDVTVHTGTSLTLSDTADIVGSVTYTSQSELTRGAGAVVQGEITHNTEISETTAQQIVQDLILMFLVILFSGLTLFFVARTRTKTLVRTVTEGYGRLGLIGLGMFLALPIVAIILIASVIGSLVGFMLLISYAVLLCLSLMSLPILVGALFQRLVRLGESVTLFTIILGTIVLFVLLFVPVIGQFAVFVLFLMSIGAFCSELYIFFKAS